VRRGFDALRSCSVVRCRLPAGAEANPAKLLAADVVEAGNVCLQTFGGFARGDDVERNPARRAYQVAPISTNLILSHRRARVGCRVF
jgi:hypothetical protein